MKHKPRRSVECAGFLGRYPGPDGFKGNGDAFPTGKARKGARALSESLRGCPVLLADGLLRRTA